MVFYRDPGVVDFDARIYRQDVSGASSFVDVPIEKMLALK